MSAAGATVAATAAPTDAVALTSEQLGEKARGHGWQKPTSFNYNEFTREGAEAAQAD